MSKIYLNTMEFYGFHGCFPEEKIVGTYFHVDLIIETNTTKAEISDSLEDTVNYLKVYQLVKKQMRIKANLLEHVANRIAEALLESFPGISGIVIKVSKMNPPLGGKLKSVSIEIEKKR